MQKTIKVVTSIIIIFILVAFYLSLNKSTNYNTENLVGNKLTQIKLESFKNKDYFSNENLKRNNFTLINFLMFIQMIPIAKVFLVPLPPIVMRI